MTLDEQLAAAHAVVRLATSDKSAALVVLRELKKQRWSYKCCRCWPSAVDGDGWCSCCDYNHVTGKREPFMDPTPEIP